MREESRRLWIQALEDLNTAEFLVEGKRYYAACFFAHQAAEKALKAAIIEKMREAPPKTHNLLELGRALGLKELEEDLMELNPEYTISRYPDAANGVPAELYNEPMAKRQVGRARKVVDACRRILSLKE